MKTLIKTAAKTLVAASAALAGTFGIADAGYPDYAGYGTPAYGTAGCVGRQCDVNGVCNANGACGSNGCVGGQCGVNGCADGRCDVNGCADGHCSVDGPNACGPNGCAVGGYPAAGYGRQPQRPFGSVGGQAAYGPRGGATGYRPRAAGVAYGTAQAPFRSSSTPVNVGVAYGSRFNAQAVADFGVDPCADGHCNLNAAPLAGRPQPAFGSRW